MAIQGGGREVWNSRNFHGKDPTLMGCNRYVKHRATATVDESYCEIFIRLRQPNNHERFRRFQEIDYAMCHELAHCEHQDHGIEFHRLMGEIQKEHSEVVQSAGEVHHPFENVEEQFGFNIYKSSNNGVSYTQFAPKTVNTLAATPTRTRQEPLSPKVCQAVGIDTAGGPGVVRTPDTSCSSSSEDGSVDEVVDEKTTALESTANYREAI